VSRLRRHAALGVILGVIASSITISGTSAAEASPKSATRSTMWDETFIDTSRPTISTVAPEQPSRILVTTIYRPKGKGPFPLIVFSHGLIGHPDGFSELLSVWANAGYVVVAPVFPLTNDRAIDPVGDRRDLNEQPADVSFVLDQVLELNEDRDSRLFRSIDERKIGAGGASWGGATTYGVAFADCCIDARITAAEVLNGIRLPVGTGPAGAIDLDGHIPLLIAHSDTDPILTYAFGESAFTDAEAPVWLVTFLGASHASQWEDEDTEYDAIAEQITLDFWDATLKGEAKAFKRLEKHGTVDGLSTIEVKR
jgi:predicted dienelactone hydrolase